MIIIFQGLKQKGKYFYQGVTATFANPLLGEGLLLSQRALAQAAQFSWEKTARDTLAVYDLAMAQ